MPFRAARTARRILSCSVGPSGSSAPSSSAQVWYCTLSHRQPSVPAQVVPRLILCRGSSSRSSRAQSTRSSSTAASSLRIVLASLPWKEKKVDLLPYHDIGRMKHDKLGTVYNPDNKPLEPPTEEEKELALRIFADRDITAGFGG